MVGHLCAFEQRAAHRHHCHSLFAKNSGVVDRKSVPLNGARVCREQNFVVFHPLFFAHPVSYLLLIFLSDELVFLNLSFEHRRKVTNKWAKKQLFFDFSFIFLTFYVLQETSHHALECLTMTVMTMMTMTVRVLFDVVRQ